MYHQFWVKHFGRHRHSTCPEMAAPTATVDLSAFNSIKRAMDTYDSVWHMRAGPWNVAKWRIIKFQQSHWFRFSETKTDRLWRQVLFLFFGGGGWERTCNIMKDSCDPSANGLLDPNDWTTHFHQACHWYSWLQQLIAADATTSWNNWISVEL